MGRERVWIVAVVGSLLAAASPVAGETVLDPPDETAGLLDAITTGSAAAHGVSLDPMVGGPVEILHCDLAVTCRAGGGGPSEDGPPSDPGGDPTGPLSGVPPASEAPATPPTTTGTRPSVAAQVETVAPVPSRRDRGPVDPLVPVVAATSIGLAAGGVSLYRRLRSDEILDNEIRARIVDVVDEDPGIHASELARRVDADVTTVLYHGRVLRETGYVTVERTDHVVAFFAHGGHSAMERELLLALRRRPKRALLETLMREPGLTVREAADRVDRAPSTVTRHADDLCDRGLLEDQREDGSRHLDVAPSARRALVALASTG